MQLFLLKAIDGCEEFDPWYDKAFGHVVRADSEEKARRLAADACGAEGKGAWLDANKTSCAKLTAMGDEEVILTDFHAA